MTLYALTIGPAAPMGATAEIAVASSPDGVPPLAKKSPSLLKMYPRIAAGGLVAAALAAVLSFPLRASVSQQAQAAAVAAPAPQPRWVEIAKPYQLYTLDAAELARLPRAYEARRQNAGPGRQDILTFGSFGGAGPWLRLNIRRFGQDNAADPGFFVDIARRAADAGLSVNHSSVPVAFASRFGAIDFANVTLERSASTVPCHAFRLADLGPGLMITGLYCAATGKSPEPGAIICLLDRLNLTGGGDDTALRQIFVNAELRREHFCAGPKYLLAQTSVNASVFGPSAPLSIEPKIKRSR